VKRAPLPLLAAFFAVGALAPRASAQVVSNDTPAAVRFPDPAKFSRGLFAQGDLGAIFFVGPMGQHVDPGPAVHVRGGYDLFRWLAVQGHVAGTANSTSALPGALSGQTLQLFTYTAEARLQLQIRRVGLYLEGGGGVAQISSNILDSVKITTGPRFSAAVVGGLGVDLHTLNRHFSVGLAGDFVWFAQWNDAYGITASTYLRYTR
jgi:hypothetical protein